MGIELINKRIIVKIIVILFLFFYIDICYAVSFEFKNEIKLENNLISFVNLKKNFINNKSTISELSDLINKSGDFYFKYDNIRSYKMGSNNWKFAFSNKELVRFVGSSGLMELIKNIDKSDINTNSDFYNLAYRRYEYNYNSYSFGYKNNYKDFKSLKYRHKLMFNILEGVNFYREDFVGQAIAEKSNSPILEKDYNINADRKVYDFSSGNSSGYSLDWSTEIILPGNINYTINISNIIGELKFKNLIYKEEDIQTDTGQRDENGNITFGPTISGFQREENYVLELPLTVYMSLDKKYGDNIVGMNIFWQEWEVISKRDKDRLEVYYKFIYKLYNENMITLKVKDNLDDFLINYNNNWFTLEFSSDSFNYNNIKKFSINVGIRCDF